MYVLLFRWHNEYWRLYNLEDFDNILIDEKSYENISVYNISYKTSVDAKPLRIRFDEIEGSIRVYDETICLVLLGNEKYDFIYHRIIGVKSGITYVISYNHAKIKADSYNSLPLEKTMAFHNVTILTKSDFNKDKNNYYYNIFLE